MWQDIESGKKDYDIRKTNKDYIQEGWTIQFVEVETAKFLGNRTVKYKTYFPPYIYKHWFKHEPTADFIKKNYLNELILIAFKIE